MPDQPLALTDGAIALDGAVSVQQRDAGLVPWRMPAGDRALAESPLLQRQFDTAGVRLSFQSDTASLAVDLDPEVGHPAQEAQGQWTVDLLVDGQRHDRQQRPRERTVFTFENLPSGTHRLAVYLPHVSPTLVRGVWIDDDAIAEPAPPRPRWITHGSSITQCGQAEGPSETWPALVGERFGLDHTNLGFGGQCKLDTVMARCIRDMPADCLSLCLGINAMGDYTERTFRQAVLNMILTVRDGHPATPLVVISPIYSPDREADPSPTGMTLQKQRQQIADAVEQLQQRGDAALHYVDGLDLFGADYLDYMPDRLHPDAEGIRLLADNVAEHVMPRFGLEPAAAK